MSGRSPSKPKSAGPAPGSAPQADSAGGKGAQNLDSLTLLKLQIHSELIKEMDLKKDLTKATDEGSRTELRNKTQAVISRLVDLRGQDLNRDKRALVIKHILDEALGLGILEELLKDKKIGRSYGQRLRPDLL